MRAPAFVDRKAPKAEPQPSVAGCKLQVTGLPQAGGSECRGRGDETLGRGCGQECPRSGTGSQPASKLRVVLSLLVGLFLSAPAGWAISAADANAAFDAFNSAYYVLSNGKGYYRADTSSSGRADFWKQAEEIEMIIDAYERSGNPNYKAMISQSIDGFLSNNGSDWLWNKYNDDIMWMVIACCRGYTATGNPTYRDRAKYHFDAVYSRGWDSTLGGGIWWTTDKNEKNACINGPAAIAACLLYEIYGDSAYLDKAKAIYAWEKGVLFDASTGKVYDNINSSGVVNTSWIFTYNQGTFIGAANYLRKLTGVSTYYDEALKAALYTKNSMCTTEILPEYNNTDDSGGFTGILARWLGRFARENNLWGTFYVWMAENANAAWTVRRADNLSWCKWRTVTPGGTLASWGCSSSVVLLQVLPTDYGLPALSYDSIALTANSYNRDVVVEKTAPATPAAGAYTTASMEGGTANTGKGWYERGYNTTAGATTTGLPAAGSTFASAAYSDHQYRMAPSYTANNAVLLNSTVASGTLTLGTAAVFAQLSFLVSAANGQGTVQAKIVHQNGNTETSSLMIPDWFSNPNPAWTANGRIDVRSFAFDNVNNNNPRLYTVDLAVADQTSAVTRIDLSYSSGGNCCILAVSGSTGAGFTPLTVTGYNQDLIIEASAPKLGALSGVTTATMQGGTANTSFTWYEAGYQTAAPNTGLPPAGASLISLVAADHRYTLAPSYTANNAVFLSASVPGASVTPAAPIAYSALSFLSAAASGPVGIGYTLRHEDGSTETGAFNALDWYNQSPMAWVANGRVSVSGAGFDAVMANNPRLYAADVAVTNTASPVTNIVLTYRSGASGADAVILAVSGIPGTVPPQLALQPQGFKCLEGTPVTLAASALATAPLAYQWQKGTNGVFVNLSDGGNLAGVTTTNLALWPVGVGDNADYRLVASNPAGAATSQVATVTVLSALPDVTRSGDSISSFGGTSPTTEGVTNAINGTTSKYLNFGLNSGSGTFQGPVGFVVTPATGPTVVSFLRFYTANDVPGRDPATYALYGSNDGGATYALISAGALALPDGRNAAGLPLDPVGQYTQQVGFSNTRSYRAYKVSFNSVKTNSVAMMQIGEVELLGLAVPTLALSGGATPGTLTLRSSVPGRLWSTAALQGTNTLWRDEGPINGSVVITPSVSEPARLYRVSVP